jgi:ABC-type transport system involved in multi-copper enzyme maturation permease subunit
MVTRRALTIARYTFLEAVRNRLFALTVTGLVCLLGLTEFIGEIAITESLEVQASLVGAGMRLFTVMTVSLFVITSVIREFNDKGFEMVLSMPIARPAWFFGKFAGFLLLAAVIAGAGSLLLMLYSAPGDVLLWFLSLQCELAIVIALSLLCLLTFSNVTVSFVLALLFYLLARAMHAVQLIAASPLLESHSFSQGFIDLVLDAIAFVLPDLHAFTRSEWLVYGGEWTLLAPVAAQTAIYVVLLSAAGLFDLYRKDL